MIRYIIKILEKENSVWNILPYYRIIKKKGPVSFLIKNQLDGSTTKAYTGDIRLENIDD